MEALQKANRMDLVGSGKKCLLFVDDNKQGRGGKGKPRTTQGKSAKPGRLDKKQTTNNNSRKRK